MTKSHPARLHIIFAKSSNKAVIFRRGPSKQICTLLWDRGKDTFTLGQWLKGRIYERRCDISPDGKYLIYFAMNGKWDSETRGSWTAISFAPWLRAIVLYAKGDCWQGGGLFLSKTSYWYNDWYFEKRNILRESSVLQRDDKYRPDRHYGAEDTGVYYVRLQRDGQQYKQHIDKGGWNAWTIFEKPMKNGFILRKICHEQVGSPVGKGCYWDEHEIIDKEGRVTKYRDWEWADSDKKRLMWAEKGCLYAIKLDTKWNIDKKDLIKDFNDMKFEEIRAPYK